MRYLFLFAFVFFVFATHAQRDTAKIMNRADYLQKSKNQKTAAWILLGIGGGMLAIAAPGHVSFDILPVLAVGGVGGVLGSIPLFIAAGRNKRKAMSASVQMDMQHAPFVHLGLVQIRSFPAVSLKVKRVNRKK